MLSPEIRQRVEKFSSDRLAKICLVLISALFLLSLPAELLCNSRPLLIHYDGRWYAPAVFAYTEQDFGGVRKIEPDYRSYQFRRLIGLEAKTAESRPPPESEGERPEDILGMFDEEPQNEAPAPSSPYAILRHFDPEPQDVPLEKLQQRQESDAEQKEPFVLWPPVRYDYAYISTTGTGGRDVLASPWRQTIPYTGEVQEPGWKDGHYLGTDDRGRDVLARLVYGFRVSLLFGVLLAVTSTVIGTILGAIQGFFGGWVDLLGQRLTEIWGSLPQLYLLIILSSLLARNIYVLFFILNLTSWMGLSAYMRAEFLRNRNLEYVRAARALGVPTTVIMRRHVLPNSLIPIITFFPFSVTGGILALVSLDFLGLGVPSPYPSLGELLAQGQANLQAIWIILPTFAVLSGTITLLTFVGEGVRKAFDPHRG